MSRLLTSLICIAIADPPKQKLMGEIVQNDIEETMQSLSILPFTKMLKMPIEDVNGLVQGAAADATNPGLKPYFSL